MTLKQEIDRETRTKSIFFFNLITKIISQPHNKLIKTKENLKILF